MFAPKLLANQQTGEDSVVDTIFEGLQEQSRLKIMHELDNREPVKIGDLEKKSEAINMVGPDFNREMFPDAEGWEGVDEFTHRRAGE